MLQEQQHRLGLQAELDEAEIAAADLRQMLTVFFGESHHGSPNSSPGTLHNRSLPNDGAWAMASSCQLPSGLPGTLHRGDSRIQCDLASIQNRLKKIAQLRDMPPSSPRSAERISPWLSLSAVGKASPFGELGHMRTLGKLSPVKLSPLKADSSQANRCNTQASTLQQVASSIDSDTEAECEVESLKLNATQGTLSADAMFIGNSDKCLNN